MLRQFNEKNKYAKIFINTEQEDLWVIQIEGELDLQSSADAQVILDMIMNEMPSRSRLIFNLQKLSYVSSTGVGLFANVVVAGNKRGIQVILRDLQPKVEQVFSLLGILSFFSIEYGP